MRLDPDRSAVSLLTAQVVAGPIQACVLLRPVPLGNSGKVTKPLLPLTPPPGVPFPCFLPCHLPPVYGLPSPPGYDTNVATIHTYPSPTDPDEHLLWSSVTSGSVSFPPQPFSYGLGGRWLPG